jgi:hypothetical protein
LVPLALVVVPVQVTVTLLTGDAGSHAASALYRRDHRNQRRQPDGVSPHEMPVGQQCHFHLQVRSIPR